MKLLKTLKELKLGQKVAWKMIDIEQENTWACIGQVKGFHKKTTYPRKLGSLVYESTEIIVFDILCKSVSESFGVELLLNHNNRNEVVSGYKYDNDIFQIWLIENEVDYVEIVKHIIADSL